MTTADDRLQMAASEVRDLTDATQLPALPAVGNQRPQRPVPAWMAAGTAAMLVLIAVGGAAWILRGAATEVADEPATTTSPTTVAEPDDGVGLVWHSVAGPSLGSVRALEPNCCYNAALGDDTWTIGHGESFTGPGPRPMPAEIGPLRSIAANGVMEVVAVLEIEASAAPYVAAHDGTSWTTAALPTDVPNPHPDVRMKYTVQEVAQGGSAFVVYGWAQPEIDPAAIVAVYPELAPVVRTDLLPPCCDGEPLSTEIADPVWVWNGDPSSEPTAISLGTIGLTGGDLLGSTGVVWMFDRQSGPAPWVATTTLTAGDVGSVAFLESGSTGGFVLLTGETTGGYDAWRSASGASWTNVESIDEDVVDLAVWERRALVLTADGSILELQPGDTWAGFADAGTFRLPDAEPANPVGMEAGDGGIVVVGERDEVLPWSDGESIPTAQVLWFSPDGSTWQHQELSDIFGDIGAVEILVTIHEGHRGVPPTVIVAFGADQANGDPIVNPQWWAAQTN